MVEKVTINAETIAGVTHLAIQDEMTIYTVLTQKNALENYLNTADAVQINLAAVNEIDSAGLQLLLWLKQVAFEKNIKLQLVAHSEAVVETLELLNLTPFFGDPVVISANWTIT